MTDRIERELELPASPARVWRSLTDPGQAAQWLADEVTLELWPGGDASFRIGDELHRGWVEEACPESRLIFWWARDGEPASRVELVLHPIRDGATRLRIVETRPLEVLDLVGVPLPGQGGARFGPALVAA